MGLTGAPGRSYAAGMQARIETAERSPLTGAVLALVAVVLARGALKAGGLVVLTGVVLATVGALVLGILALRLVLG